MSMGRTATVGVWLALAVATLCGCTNRISSAAPPTVVCGTVLDRTPAGAVVWDIARYQDLPSMTGVSPPGRVYVRVSDDCRHGSDVTIRPADALRVVTVAPAADGKPEAVVLQPLRYVPTRIVATRGGRPVGSLSLELAKP
jgi:hypothetical protein